MVLARALRRGKPAPPLAVARRLADGGVMWREPYLETCCRSALHRLTLAGDLGRPAGLSDGACLSRLAGLGLAGLDGDGRYMLTARGVARHQGEILHRASPSGDPAAT